MSSPEDPSPIGRELDGRYRIEAEIGVGGLGAVYRATHGLLGKPVAIKLLHVQYGENALLRARFEREAKALAALDHPNIVSVTDYGVSGNTPFLVMELLEGQTLSQRISKGPIDAKLAAALAGDLLRALAFVHSRGLVHRDVKPGNVFLQRAADGGERLKLLDFGLAKFTERANAVPDATLTRAGDLLGTPAYMAPEQAAGDDTDARSDVYSAGVLLFQMLTGRVPFQGDAVDQLRGHFASPVPALAEANPARAWRTELDAILQRAMAKRREDRYDDAEQLLRALEAVPQPWLQNESASSDAALGMANTMLLPVDGSSGALTTPQPALEQSIKPGEVKARRSGVGPAFVVTGALLTIVAVTFYRERSEHTQAAPPAAATQSAHEDATPAAPEVGAPSEPEDHENVPAAAAPEAAPAPEPPVMPEALPAAGAASAAPETGEAEPAPPAQETGEAEPAPAPPAQEAAAAPPPTEAVPTAPARTTPTPAAPSRPPARNPWARGVPKTLVKLRKAITHGEVGNDRTVNVLRHYNQAHEDDVRGHLLLARLYLNREWRADALNQLSLVVQKDPAARGAPEMLPTLVRLVVQGAVASDASTLIARNYGSEARGAIDRALAQAGSDPGATQRLRNLQARIASR